MDPETLVRPTLQPAASLPGDPRTAHPNAAAADIDGEPLAAALRAPNRPFTLDMTDGAVVFGEPGEALHLGASRKYVPAVRLEDLGDPSFRADHRLRYAYLAGAMANGTGSADIVEAMGRAGMLGFFGAAGLSLPTIEAAIDRIERNLGRLTPSGFNLIHSPNEPDHEAAVVDLYLRRGI